MPNINHDYSHSEFKKCIEVGVFAKIFENHLTCKCGKSVGRNKVYEVFKALGIVCKDNTPSQSFARYFKIFVKTYPDGSVKNILLIKHESKEFLLEKIQAYVSEKCVHKSSKVSAVVNRVSIEHQEPEVVKASCPLDFGRDEAIAWVEGLPNIGMAAKVREKFGLSA